MKYIHLGVCICIFLFVHNQILRADETVSDDSLYTAESALDRVYRKFKEVGA